MAHAVHDRVQLAIGFANDRPVHVLMEMEHTLQLIDALTVAALQVCKRR